MEDDDAVQDDGPRKLAWTARHGGVFTPPANHDPIRGNPDPCPYNPRWRWTDGTVDVATLFGLGKLMDILEALEAAGEFKREEAGAVAEVF